MNFFREIVVALPAELFLLQKHNNNKFEVSKIYMTACTCLYKFYQIKKYFNYIYSII